MELPHLPLPLLPINDMASRHPGLTPEIAAYYLQAASVCLARHHESPCEFEIIEDTQTQLVRLEWQAPNLRQWDAWANQTDTTEAGACNLALAAVELYSGLVAARRAETSSGIDYYLTHAGQPAEPLRTAVRLEISGTHLGWQEVESRLRRKLMQVEQGQSEGNALAVVVGFQIKKIVIGKLGVTS
jgi:hypothetical protein